MKINVSTGLIAIVVALVDGQPEPVHGGSTPECHRVPAGRDRIRENRAGTVLQGAAGRQRAFFDSRILTLDAEEGEKFRPRPENKPVLVDSFVKLAHRGRRQYYVSVQGDENLARVRLTQAVTQPARGIRQAHDS